MPTHLSAHPARPTTSDAEWRAALAPVPRLDDVVTGSGRVVVVAPHPDDEVIGAGGLIGLLGRSGRDVTVVAVTDGEASHPGAPGLAARRRREQRRALRRVGWRVAIDRLGVPDREVAEHVALLADALIERSAGASLIVAPWQGDGHADHDATGRAAAEAAGTTGVRLLSYPVWLWQWATVSEATTLPLRRLDLPEDVRQAKAAAMGCFRSQTETGDGRPILDDEALERTSWPWEVFVDDRPLPS